jgi:hypothetical protein
VTYLRCPNCSFTRANDPKVFGPMTCPRCRSEHGTAVMLVVEEGLLPRLSASPSVVRAEAETRRLAPPARG